MVVEWPTMGLGRLQCPWYSDADNIPFSWHTQPHDDGDLTSDVLIDSRSGLVGDQTHN